MTVLLPIPNGRAQIRSREREEERKSYAIVIQHSIPLHSHLGLLSVSLQFHWISVPSIDVASLDKCPLLLQNVCPLFYLHTRTEKEQERKIERSKMEENSTAKQIQGEEKDERRKKWSSWTLHNTTERWNSKAWLCIVRMFSEMNKAYE